MIITIRFQAISHIMSGSWDPSNFIYTRIYSICIIYEITKYRRKM